MKNREILIVTEGPDEAKIEQFYVLCTCVFYVLDFDETKYFVS